MSDEREAALEARSKFYHRSGDHMTLLNVFKAFDDISHPNDLFEEEGDTKAPLVGGLSKKEWCRRNFINDRALTEATKIRAQIRKSCHGSGMDINISCGDADEPVLRCLYRGLVHNIALKQADGSYKHNDMVCQALY
jgi:ATP-dependent RNA helicase DHX33